eukprot:501468_1
MLASLILVYMVSRNTAIKCTTVQSHLSTVRSERATASCQGYTNFPTLVSCGFSTKDPTEEEFEGSYIENNICKARNAVDGAGVYAWARCCKFEDNDVSCYSEDAIKTEAADSNDELSTKKCPDIHYMLGCTAHTSATRFDGCFPGGVHDHPKTAIAGQGTGPNVPYTYSRVCNGQHGTSSGLTEYNINCCSVSEGDGGLECNLYYAPAGTDNALQCPAHQTMIACMGQEDDMNINAWHISKNTDNPSHACITRGTSSSNPAYTIALCCNEITLSPTNIPTGTPSKHPTNQPSPAPTLPSEAPTSPSIEPTEYPTSTRAPSMEPTLSTGAPSKYPSVSPTRSSDPPSTAPTKTPSAHPSEDTGVPSSAPSSQPSATPTDTSDSPSSNPSVSPVVIITTIMATTTTKGKPKGKGRSGLFGVTESENETVYMWLFIIFGTLFCCLLSGILYYFYRKNKRQGEEVRYENAAAAGGHPKDPANDASKVFKPYKKMEDEVDDDVLKGINGLDAEGVANGGTGTGNGTGTGGTEGTGTGTSGIDASLGIITGDSGHGMQTSATTAQLNTAEDNRVSGNTTRTSPGVNMRSEEDDEKAVFSVEM